MFGHPLKLIRLHFSAKFVINWSLVVYLKLSISHLATEAAAFTLYRRKKQLFVLLTSKLKRANMVCNFV